jgi:hypothetical protein
VLLAINAQNVVNRELVLYLSLELDLKHIWWNRMIRYLMRIGIAIPDDPACCICHGCRDLIVV